MIDESAPLRVGFAIPGDEETVRTAVSGGYEYDRRLLSGLPEAGVEVSLIPLPRAFPEATAAQIAATAEALSGFDGPLLIDGLGFCAIDAATAQAVGGRAAALLHHPLYIEPGLNAGQAKTVEAREREMLAASAAIVVTSQATAEDAVARFGFEPSVLHVAPPGVDRPKLLCKPSGQRLTADGVKILSVGAVIPRKGYLELVQALARLEGENGVPAWRLEIAGPLNADPAYAAEVRGLITERGLADKITLLGPLAPPALAQAYQTADLFVSASRLEGFGMAAAEATAHGLPVVAASPAIWAWAPWAVRVPSQGLDDTLIEGLSATLPPLLHDEHTRAAAVAASRRGAAGLPRWEQTVRVVAAALRTLTKENG